MIWTALAGTTALPHALHLPPAGPWQLDVAPLAVHLTHRTGRWHLHLPATAH